MLPKCESNSNALNVCNPILSLLNSERCGTVFCYTRVFSLSVPHILTGLLLYLFFTISFIVFSLLFFPRSSFSCIFYFLRLFLFLLSRRIFLILLCFWKLKEKDSLENLGTEGRVILKRVLNSVELCGLN